ncbi:MAG: eukaryotic-like serine/threonine-protein kinase [Actinomycetota bacterium]|nr:eukaryotic-like serine/threonine-protein kinase [Actinomycetota bacterium]
MVAGRYELLELIGRGGMSEVWAAHDHRLRRAVAVKLLPPELAALPGPRRRFEAEARAAARLNHPHVVAVFDFGDEGRPFIVMERLDGRTLADELAAGPLPIADVKDIGGQVLDALAAAHDTGLVHRDVKPGNVLLVAPGTWKVGDFGIAASMAAGGAEPGTTVLMFGTPGYLSPERLAGLPPSVADDLYAVARMLREASGHEQPDPDLDAVIARATASDPTTRFADARQMRAALGDDEVPALVTAHPEPQAPPTVPTPAATVGVAAATAKLPAASKAPSHAARRPIAARRRRNVRAIAVIMLAAAGVAAGAFAHAQSSSVLPAPSTAVSSPRAPVTTVAPTVAPTAAPVTTATPPTKPRHGKKHDQGGD